MPWYILNQTQVSTKGDFRLNIINQVMNKIHPYRINNPSFYHKTDLSILMISYYCSNMQRGRSN